MQINFTFSDHVQYDGIRIYAITISYRRSTWIRYQKSYILVSDSIEQTFIQSMHLTAQIEEVQDKSS